MPTKSITSWINPTEVHINKAYLIRHVFDSAHDPIDAQLKTSIREHGFLSARPITVDMIEGKITLIEGYRRLTAALELREEGAFLGSIAARFAKKED